MTWQEALQEYFENLNPPQQQWLQEQVLLDAPLLQDVEDVAIFSALFPFQGRLNHTAFLKTLVWQTLGLVLCGEEDPCHGNIRSFWYNYVDPLYSRHKLYKTIRSDEPFYREFLEELDDDDKILRGPENQIKKRSTLKLSETTIQDFVMAGIFKYSGPFQFKDSKSGQALVGRGTASIILFCEKEGMLNFVKEAYQQHGISIFCSNGNASSLSLEVFADQLKAKGIVNVSPGGLVDYDPSGFGIYSDFLKKLIAFGFNIRRFTRLTSLQLFTEKSLATKYNDLNLETLPKNKRALAKAWFEETGGIHGLPRSIHINKASKARIRKAWNQWIKEEKADKSLS